MSDLIAASLGPGRFAATVLTFFAATALVLASLGLYALISYSVAGGFRAFAAARRTVDGYEAMRRIRKGQVRWVPAGNVILQNRFIDRLFGLVQ